MCVRAHVDAPDGCLRACVPVLGRQEEGQTLSKRGARKLKKVRATCKKAHEALQSAS